MHEVVDDQLRASVEELGKGPRAFVGLEAVLLLDRDPGQLLSLSSELVTAAGQLLLALQQRLAGLQPLLAAASSHPLAVHSRQTTPAIGSGNRRQALMSCVTVLLNMR